MHHYGAKFVVKFEARDHGNSTLNLRVVGLLHVELVDRQEVNLARQIVLVNFIDDLDHVAIRLYHVVEEPRARRHFHTGEEVFRTLQQLNQRAVIALYYLALRSKPVSEYFYHLNTAAPAFNYQLPPITRSQHISITVVVVLNQMESSKYYHSYNCIILAFRSLKISHLVPSYYLSITTGGKPIILQLFFQIGSF